MESDCDHIGRAFAQAVRELRKERLQRSGKSGEYSQEALALEMQMDRTYISALERGNPNPTLRTMCRLSRALDVTMSQLMRRIERHSDRNPIR